MNVVIIDICKMAKTKDDNNKPNICKYNYYTDGYKYSPILGKCVNKDKMFSLFNLLLLVTIMIIIVGVSFVTRKIMRQQKRIGKINRSYSRLFGNKIGKII